MANLQEILSKMSIKEKAYQLLQLNTMAFAGKDDKDRTGPKIPRNIDTDYLFECGAALNSVGAEKMIEIQSNYLEKSKNKIPLIFMQDVIHGYRTLYPINLAIASSFDTDLARDCASMAAKEASIDGVQLTFAPMVDLVRDGRWGRVMESSGEDPYLNSLMSKATVEGFQGDMGKYNVAACVKHFAAYGGAEGGRDYNSVDMGEQTLREYYLPAYKAAVDAGVLCLMTSFNSLNGVPSAGNKWLVKDILRDEWGYDNVIISDYASFMEMVVHGYAEDEKDAAYKAMMATGDIEMVSTTYPRFLEELINEGKITEAQLDKAVMRVLELKDRLGLFDNPFRYTDPEEAKKIILCKEHRDLARYACEQSAVLLKNDGILPLSENVGSVALIGPIANTGEIFGNWHCGARSEETTTVLEGFKSILGDRVRYAKGCEDAFDSTDESGISEAVELAKNSEAVVLCLGENQWDNGEGNSKAILELPEIQYKLLDAVLAVNKNVAVVLFTGRPLALDRLDRTAPAILNAWEPGTEGGSAIANLVFARAVPSGKLTMSFPYATGQCPIYYNHYNTGRPKLTDELRVRFTASYIDVPSVPLYPFGHGLSYSSFEYSDRKIDKTVMRRGEKITASVKVTNTGKYKAKEVVQLYIRDLCGSVVRPVKELKGFEKIELDVGESRVVTFEITEDTLAFYGSDLTRKAEAGKFHIFIDTTSDCKEFATFELTED